MRTQQLQLMNLTKFYYLMATLFGLPLFILSQNKIISESNNTNSNVKVIGNNTNIIVCFNNNKIYFTDQFNIDTKKNRNIYYYDILNNNYSTIKIEYNKANKAFFYTRIFSFELENNKLIVLTDSYIFTLLLEQNTATVIKSVKNAKASFNKIIKISNENFLLYVNYNFHPLDALDKHVWAIYNLETSNISSITKMDEVDYIFTHLVNNWLSVYKGLIAHSQSSNYKVFFYNDKFKTIDSLVSNKLIDNNKFLNNLNKNVKSKDDIYNIIKQDDSSLTRIQKIFLLDSNNLLVMVKLPKTRDMVFDLWKKINNQWMLQKTEMSSPFYREGEMYNNTNNTFNPLYGNLNGIAYDNNYNFYVIYSPFIENIETKSFNIDEDYNKKVNDMVKKNNLYYGVRKISISK